MNGSRVHLIGAITLLATLVVLAMPMPIQAQDEPGIKVDVSRDTIGLDEETILTVTVAGSTQRLATPSMPGLPKFDVYSQGQSSNTSIVNGKVSSTVSYRYMILPKEAGSFEITNVSVVLNNKRFVADPVTLTVLNRGTATSPKLEERAKEGDGRARDYFLEAAVDSRNPYVNQQVTLTLKFYIAVQYYGSPELVEPTTTGFWTEILGNKAPYHQRINNRTYRVIERKYALFPTRTGALSIGRATITAMVASSNRKRRDPFDIFGRLGAGQEVSVRSQAIKVTVKPLPDAGRPSDFSGSIGQFRIEASTTRNEVEVNQPVTVRFAIKGVGNIKSVAAPNFDDIEDFRVYQASSDETVSKLNDKIGGTKVFEEVFIPRRPGLLQIPSVSLSYFDPLQGKYKSIRTRPISLKVTKPEGIAATPDMPYAAPETTIGSETSDIRYIKSDPGQMTRRGELIVSSPVYVAVNAASVLLFAAAVFYRRRKERLTSDIGYARARAALSKARKRLSKARSLASPDHSREFFTECSLAVMSYVADKLNISPHGLTSESFAALLNENGANEQLLEETNDLLSKCDLARFGATTPGTDDIKAALKQAEGVMVQMENLKL